MYLSSDEVVCFSVGAASHGRRSFRGRPVAAIKSWQVPPGGKVDTTYAASAGLFMQNKNEWMTASTANECMVNLIFDRKESRCQRLFICEISHSLTDPFENTLICPRDKLRYGFNPKATVAIALYVRAFWA
jgi:hypothetical protein